VQLLHKLRNAVKSRAEGHFCNTENIAKIEIA
jgi:hypothetical protein